MGGIGRRDVDAPLDELETVRSMCEEELGGVHTDVPEGARLKAIRCRNSMALVRGRGTHMPLNHSGPSHRICTMSVVGVIFLL